jgi:hypothetical protein
MSFKDVDATMIEYVKANSEQLDYLRDLMDVVLDNSGVVIAEKAWPDSIPIITQGSITPEFICLDPGPDGLNNASIDFISSINSSFKEIAASEFYGFRAMLSLLSGRYKREIGLEETLEEEEDHEEALRKGEWLNYAHADTYFTRPTEIGDLDVYRTRLHRVELYGDTARYKAIHEDDGICRTLGITVVRNVAVHAGLNIEPLNDSLMTRIVSIPGPEAKLLGLPLAGLFRSEAELDEMLETVRYAYRNGEHADAVEELLDEVREQAIAKKETREMGLIIGPPSQDDLDEFKVLLEQKI